MKKWKQYVWLLMLVLTLGLAACANNAEPAKEIKQEEKVAEAAFPVTVKDAFGDVTIEKEPAKIVSLIPSNTEIAYALGLGDKIVGVSDFDNYPEDVKNKEKIGGMEFNVEKIIALQPDVVLAHASSAHNSEEGLKQLKDAGITVIVVPNATSLNDVYASIELIGKATGKTKEASDVVKQMKQKIDAIAEKAKEVKEEATVWVEVSPAPEIYTAGKGTFMDEMLTIIHAKNAAGDQEGWPMFTEEDAVALNPDVIITTYGYYTPNAVEQVLARPAWKEVPAIKNKRVYDVNSDLVSRPGPRLAEGVEEIAKVVYPDIFK